MTVKDLYLRIDIHRRIYLIPTYLFDYPPGYEIPPKKAMRRLRICSFDRSNAEQACSLTVTPGLIADKIPHPVSRHRQKH
jgi:hypothetical protein